MVLGPQSKPQVQTIRCQPSWRNSKNNKSRAVAAHTRNAEPSRLVWMEGPAFLKDDESAWPAVLPSEENAEQTGDCERQTKTRMHVTKPLLKPEAPSSRDRMGTTVPVKLQTSQGSTEKR